MANKLLDILLTMWDTSSVGGTTFYEAELRFRDPLGREVYLFGVNFLLNRRPHRCDLDFREFGELVISAYVGELVAEFGLVRSRMHEPRKLQPNNWGYLHELGDVRVSSDYDIDGRGDLEITVSTNGVPSKQDLARITCAFMEKLKISKGEPPACRGDHQGVY